MKGKCCHGTGPEPDNYFMEADRRVSVVIRQDMGPATISWRWIER